MVSTPPNYNTGGMVSYETNPMGFNGGGNFSSGYATGGINSYNSFNSGNGFNNFNSSGQNYNKNGFQSRNSNMNNYKDPSSTDTKVQPNDNCKDFTICDPKTQRPIDNVPNEVKMPGDEDVLPIEDKVKQNKAL